ncbi:DUF6950 family protein [Paracoccus sp. ME4]|uniref:DUF6950 family protein n=1 Tax=Paracoccus sp. ME4 TaxID=3138066 RepID=UPI00398BA764
MMQHLTRRDDWRARLAAEMDRQRRTPFAWGRQDCAIGFAATIVEALTGVDLAGGYRGRYAGPRAAAKILADAGAATLADFAAQQLPEIHPSRADLGDIGVIEADGPFGQAFCMVDASGLVVMTPEGHGRRPRADMIRAFKVG